jgi:transglutaminase/protease-like cytokinesis protein 3
MASRTGIFAADFAYSSGNEGELSFQEGDNIRILNSDGEWWFGELIRTKEQGWLSPAYGHIVEDVTPYVSTSDQEKITKRSNLLKEIMRVESAYSHDLDIFVKVVITPLFQRDNAFKRSFLNEPSIAVSLTILHDIYQSSIRFFNDIAKAENSDKIASAYVVLAPSLQLYSQYASENAACLNAVKSFGRQLREFMSQNPLPQGLSFESCLVLPLEHYSKYASNLQEFVWLTPANRPELASLQLALDAVNAQTVKIDDTLNELDASIKLLSLQSQCKYLTRFLES